MAVFQLTSGADLFPDGDDNTGSDYIYGLAGVDTIDAGDANDTVIGGDAGDLIYGGAGDDSLFGDHPTILAGISGNDTIFGGADDDTDRARPRGQRAVDRPGLIDDGLRDGWTAADYGALDTGALRVGRRSQDEHPPSVGRGDF
jgi:Ca2+-binding RTX toxin-like protein